MVTTALIPTAYLKSVSHLCSGLVFLNHACFFMICRFNKHFMDLKVTNCGMLHSESTNRRSWFCILFLAVAFLSMVFLFGGSSGGFDYEKKVSTWGPNSSIQKFRTSQSNACERSCTSSGSEPLPEGIVSSTSNLEMRPLWDSPSSPKIKVKAKPSKSLLALAVGIKQKDIVNQIVEKFPSSDFTIILFHYDAVVDKWRDLQWSDNALHVSAMNQTKWWFAKRFLHPNIVAEYDYIFLWDEDLGVEHFNPIRYLSIVRREGLEISQPALDTAKGGVHYRITARKSKGDLHRRIYKFNGGGRCYANSTAPPCTGWVEMMAPVFSRAAWRCAWHMIQNDLIHAWGLDYKLGYCAQGDRTKNVGVVDGEYIVHKGIPSLGGLDNEYYKVPPGPGTYNGRLSVRARSYTELLIFKDRWQKAVTDDVCWTDPYPEPEPAKKITQ